MNGCMRCACVKGRGRVAAGCVCVCYNLCVRVWARALRHAVSSAPGGVRRSQCERSDWCSREVRGKQETRDEPPDWLATGGGGGETAAPHEERELQLLIHALLQQLQLVVEQLQGPLGVSTLP